MIGQGLLADPALTRKAKGGSAATVDELRTFHELLLPHLSPPSSRESGAPCFT